MAPRAYWTGHMRLSLVTLPVRVYAATTQSQHIALHHVDRETGERVRYQPVVPDVGPIDKERIGKGYEYAKERYLILEDEDLRKLKLDSAKTIDLVRFCDAGELDPIYVEKPYYVAPDGPIAEDAFRVIREALRKAGKVALGRVALAGQERIAAIQVRDQGLMLTTMRSRDEVRSAEHYFEDIADKPVDQDQLELALMLIRSKTAPFNPDLFEDRYQTALKELVQAKLQGVEPAAAPTRREANVVNLMDALRRSVEAETAGPAKPTRAAKPAKGKAEAKKPKADERPKRKPKAA